MFHHCATHAQDSLFSTSSLDQLNLPQSSRAHQGQDDVRSVVLLHEDCCVAGPNSLYDSSSINSVCMLPHLPCGGREDPVLASLIGPLRVAYWCAIGGVHH
mmetsp:Transcript_9168/g.19245  ORF Transcript_9168/g.19245 Transcript_9168/m.19245 type:complete len:101 (+) Transcript_9168:3096-3398(+)